MNINIDKNAIIIDFSKMNLDIFTNDTSNRGI